MNLGHFTTLCLVFLSLFIKKTKKKEGEFAMKKQGFNLTKCAIIVTKTSRT
jgi:hypothetical protein